MFKAKYEKLVSRSHENSKVHIEKLKKEITKISLLIISSFLLMISLVTNNEMR